MSEPLHRRTVLRGAALVGIACVGAAACSAGGSGSGSAPKAPTQETELGAAAEIPVGGAKLYPEEKLVVSQPVEGTFKCFSSVCTHMGAVLNKLDKEVATCPLHGSQFDVATGKPVHGPATKPLEEVPVKVKGGKLIAG
ncbi:Rieske (2Fe-2S) protein [Streptomyces olivaceiscleroticus]|uniref:Cytochrome bc1 complex Rieske iron-sulfur subunit n=1 Tax=Streptomyces olivaceiscleroticus TaxID=68245 RepID=A0ABN1AVX0_9ACTN